jgi:hypothetical protein
VACGPRLAVPAGAAPSAAPSAQRQGSRRRPVSRS